MFQTRSLYFTALLFFFLTLPALSARKRQSYWEPACLPLLMNRIQVEGWPLVVTSMTEFRTLSKNLARKDSTLHEIFVTSHFDIEPHLHNLSYLLERKTGDVLAIRLGNIVDPDPVIQNRYLDKLIQQEDVKRLLYFLALIRKNNQSLPLIILTPLPKETVIELIENTRS